MPGLASGDLEGGGRACAGRRAASARRAGLQAGEGSRCLGSGLPRTSGCVTWSERPAPELSISEKHGQQSPLSVFLVPARVN